MKHFWIASCVCLAASGSAQAKEGLTGSENGLTLKTGPFELNLGGRLHLDAASFNDPTGSSTRDSRAKIRRARLELSGRIGKAVRFRVDREFAPASKGWRNLWVSLEPIDNLVVKAGNFVIPFSGEDLESSNTMPFAERSLMTALTPSYGLGGSISASGRNWSASMGYFKDPIGDEGGRTPSRGKGFAGRITFAPVKTQVSTVHVGIGVERRHFSGDERPRFSADPGSSLAPTLMSSGRIAHVDSLTGLSAEAGGAFGSLLLQGQWVRAHLARNGTSNLGFSGQTLQARWLVTGGDYDYSVSQGTFGGPKLHRGKRAVEIAGRISRLDLNSGRIQRGTGLALTGGLNWYLSRNLRLMADYTANRVRLPEQRSTIHDSVAVGRLQIAF